MTVYIDIVEIECEAFPLNPILTKYLLIVTQIYMHVNYGFQHLVLVLGMFQIHPQTCRCTFTFAHTLPLQMEWNCQVMLRPPIHL